MLVTTLNLLVMLTSKLLKTVEMLAKLFYQIVHQDLCDKYLLQ